MPLSATTPQGSHITSPHSLRLAGRTLWQTCSPAQDPSEPELVLMLHTVLQTAVSLQELQAASTQDPVFTQLYAFIQEGWPTRVPDSTFQRVKDDLSCWNNVCVARGLCTVVPSALRPRILTMRVMRVTWAS